MYEKIKLKIIEKLLSTTAHGITNIVQTERKLIKYLWILVTFASFSFCSFFVLQSILDYLKYDVVTKINTYNEKTVEFPAISICSRTNFDNFKLLRCYFNFQECSLSNINYFQDSLYGTCIRFNSGYDIYGNKTNILHATSNDLLSSLMFEIYLPSQNGYSEMTLAITNKSYIPFNMVENPYYLMSGNSYFFQIQRTFSEKLESPFNDCLKDVRKFKFNKTIIDFILSSNRTYTQLNCFRFCRNLYLIQESGCGCETSLENFEPICQYQNFNLESIKCINNYIQMFQNKMANKECSKYCPAECDSLSYTIIPFIRPFPVTGNVSEEFSSRYVEFKTYEDVQKNFISFYVYYPEFKYTLISQSEKITLYDVISNIGGLLGLFLGISFLSFVEIFLIWLLYS